MVKSRPIIFSGDMINAIIENRKSMTRRVLKPQPDEIQEFIDGRLAIVNSGRFDVVKCPYGKIGDQLYVKETFSITKEPNSYYPSYDWRRGGTCIYKADEKRAVGMYGCVKWKSPIYMPKWASRITLEITSIRVERLKVISDDDCLAEGIFFTDYGKRCLHNGYGDVETCPSKQGHQQKEGWSYKKTNRPEECLGSAKMAFANLSYKSKINWDQNPFVWCLTFKVIKNEK